MTDDLVNKLRAIDHLSIEDCYCQSPLYAEAAYRIEALTAERDQWIQHAKNAVWADSEELKVLTADNARLREALTEIAEDTGYNSGDQHHDAQMIARAALTGKEPSHE
jgi:hypothetical protein